MAIKTRRPWKGGLQNPNGSDGSESRPYRQASQESKSGIFASQTPPDPKNGHFEAVFDVMGSIMPVFSLYYAFWCNGIRNSGRFAAKPIRSCFQHAGAAQHRPVLRPNFQVGSLPWIAWRRPCPARASLCRSRQFPFPLSCGARPCSFSITINIMPALSR